MKVLMISGDVFILDPNSTAGKRTEEYRNFLSELEFLVCHGNIFSFLSGFYHGCKLMYRKKFDIITAQSPEHWFLAWLFSIFFKIPWQMQIHTDIFSPYFVKGSVFNKIRVLLAKFLILRADCVRVVSERIKNSLKAYSLRYIVVLPVFVDIEKIKNMPIKTDLHQKYPGRFIILIASRLTREKNVGLAIDAVSSLIRANKRIMLLIVGDGSKKESLKFHASHLNIDSNIILEPWAQDIISYYKTCDLFLLTSDYEGYGMTLVEAAASGAKIISSDVGVASEILKQENIFKVGDKNDLISKLKFAVAGKISSPKLIRQLADIQTKEDYLLLYKESLEKCIKK